MVISLEATSTSGNVKHRRSVLSAPSLMVVDEIGYVPIGQHGTMLFYQFMSRRYERASTVLTLNKSFEEYGDVIGNEVMAAVMVDLVMHHCHIANIRGNSYRMRHHAAVPATLRPLRCHRGGWIDALDLAREHHPSGAPHAEGVRGPRDRQPAPRHARGGALAHAALPRRPRSRVPARTVRRDVDQLLGEAGDIIRTVTYAPELPGSVELTERLAVRDIVPALDRTEATFEQAEAVILAGAWLVTHMYAATLG
jgi:hypothetical protein